MINVQVMKSTLATEKYLLVHQQRTKTAQANEKVDSQAKTPVQ